MEENDLEVSADIEDIIEAVKNKENILIHSPGGTGKSYLLKILAQKCLEWKRRIACTAPTGVAALGLSQKFGVISISGCTINSFGGIGLGDAPVEKLLERVLKWPGSRAKWMLTDVLEIDEISMTAAGMLDNLDYIARHVRRINKPFGGMQLIFGGDFLQLPPPKAKWAFTATVWDQLKLKPFSLYTPQRYPDEEWFHLLLRVRKAQHTAHDVKFLFTRVRAYEKWLKDMQTAGDDPNIVKPTVLHSRKADVELDNDVELQKLEASNEVTFTATDLFKPFSHHAKKEYYLKSLEDAIPKSITLRVGAQVMLKANLDQKEGYINGSRGVIVNICAPTVMVKWVSGETTEVGENVWTQEDKDGKATRAQIPLILAWALTIHRCQGATLDYAICNLGPTVFSPGQAYVALSRVRSSDGLLLQEFYPNVIKADPDALAFVEGIETATSRPRTSKVQSPVVEDVTVEYTEEENLENLGEENIESIEDIGEENIESIEDIGEENLESIEDIGEENLESTEEVEVVYVMNFVGWTPRDPMANSNNEKKVRKSKIEKYESVVAPTDDYLFSELFENMKAWRGMLATEQAIPAYRIMNNATLTDICYYRPATLEDLIKIKGIGPANIENYGEEILKLIVSSTPKRRLGKNLA
jgi:ATP-dependent DNA helicase PIF1